MVRGVSKEGRAHCLRVRVRARVRVRLGLAYGESSGRLRRVEWSVRRWWRVAHEHSVWAERSVRARPAGRALGAVAAPLGAGARALGSSGRASARCGGMKVGERSERAGGQRCVLGAYLSAARAARRALLALLARALLACTACSLQRVERSVGQ